jgi:hypothetical protein
LDPDYEHEAVVLSKSDTEVVPWFPPKSAEQTFDKIEHCSKMPTLIEAILGIGWQGLYCMTMFSKKVPRDKPAHPMNLNNLILTPPLYHGH